jgi:hypothetical protein
MQECQKDAMRSFSICPFLIETSERKTFKPHLGTPLEDANIGEASLCLLGRPEANVGKDLVLNTLGYRSRHNQHSRLPAIPKVAVSILLPSSYQPKSIVVRRLVS